MAAMDVQRIFDLLDVPPHAILIANVSIAK
jgi:hypothetical protein